MPRGLITGINFYFLRHFLYYRAGVSATENSSGPDCEPYHFIHVALVTIMAQGIAQD